MRRIRSHGPTRPELRSGHRPTSAGSKFVNRKGSAPPTEDSKFGRNANHDLLRQNPAEKKAIIATYGYEENHTGARKIAANSRQCAARTGLRRGALDQGRPPTRRQIVNLIAHPSADLGEFLSMPCFRRRRRNRKTLSTPFDRYAFGPHHAFPPGAGLDGFSTGRWIGRCAQTMSP